MATQVTVDDGRMSELAEGFSGELLRPRDPDYEEVRKIHNGLIDRRPALIARCTGVADVSDAVNFARDNGLEVSVRGGGHNVAGRAVTEGGVMIDLSKMKGLWVDPARQTVRAQAGLTWGEFNRGTQAFGLATTGGIVSTTGIAGLTLGGGIGWLMGKHGLAVDNLLSAEVVTAAGEIVNASAEENQELFWGLRGGGGNFGVVTSFEYRLHPLEQVVGGLTAYPFANATEVLKFYREQTAAAPDELTMFAALVHAPDPERTPVAAILACYSGAVDDGIAAVRPLKEFGPPIMDEMGPMPYEPINKMLDGEFPRGALNYWKSAFLSELSDAAIETMVEQYRACTSPMSGMVIEHIHGAVSRVGATDTAFPFRDDGYNFLIVAQWQDLAESDQHIAWARNCYAAMQPFFGGGAYVNYLGEGEDPVENAYGPNFDRLRALKKKYDPDNFFRMNQNITPAS